MVSISHHSTPPTFHDVDQQCLRILRCTARAMAATPGGLRFEPGARPWLEGLTLAQPVAHAGGGGRDGAAGGVAADSDSKP
jgi:hypothetical protein